MNQPLHDLARAAGIVPIWQDVHGVMHEVSDDTIRAILAALDLPASTDALIAESRAEIAQRDHTLPPMLTAEQHRPTPIPLGGPYAIMLESGERLTGIADGALPGVGQIGYHRLDIGGQTVGLAVAPAAGYTVHDACPGIRPWVLAVQLYALRRANDGGLGDFKSLEDLLAPAARLGAAGVAISPVHAQFSADPDRFSPYSPSSRIQLNVLHATLDLPPDLRPDLPPDLPSTFPGDPATDRSLVDWPKAGRRRLAAFRVAFDRLTEAELDTLARFRAEEGSALETHATFEALHARQFAEGRWHWRTWPADLQNPESLAVRHFARGSRRRGPVPCVDAVRGRPQPRPRPGHSPQCRHADRPDRGPRSRCGFGRQPLLEPSGRNFARHEHWRTPRPVEHARPKLGVGGVLAPAACGTNGYRAFIEMLRHAMRHAGGVRIDHALGLARLWVVPEGASSKEGAYLTMPTEDLLRLTALESHRHRAVVLGEDLGTIPDGFQERLAAAGTLGMRVLWFEKKHGLFLDPQGWTRAAAAMTSTHDLATVAGWWSGRDLAWRGQLGLAGSPANQAYEEAERITDRAALWNAFRHSGAAEGLAPEPGDTAGAVDAAIRHLATANCDLVILPIEDALALTEQPNLPGTGDQQHPNWRRRLPGMAANLLDDPRVAARLEPLNKARPLS